MKTGCWRVLFYLARNVFLYTWILDHITDIGEAPTDYFEIFYQLVINRRILGIIKKRATKLISLSENLKMRVWRCHLVLQLRVIESAT